MEQIGFLPSYWFKLHYFRNTADSKSCHEKSLCAFFEWVLSIDRRASGNHFNNKDGGKSNECIYTEIHQKWSSDTAFDRSHWDLQLCRNKSKNSYEFQLLFQSESLTNFDWNCSVLLAIRRCFECFRVLLFLSCVGWLTIDSRMWALFWEVRNRTCIKPGRETRHLKHLQNHGEQDRSTQCCGFFCCDFVSCFCEPVSHQVLLIDHNRNMAYDEDYQMS